MVKEEKALSQFKMAIFKQRLKKKDIAKRMGISNGHLINILNGRDTFSDEKRKQLNKILNTNY